MSGLANLVHIKTMTTRRSCQAGGMACLNIFIHAPKSIEPLRVRLDVAHGSVHVAHLLPHQALSIYPQTNQWQ